MSTTLPPIGARIRTTTRHDGGATVVIEGIVTSHPAATSLNQDNVIVGDGEGVTAYVQDWPGAKVTVEVLELPLPPEPADGGHAFVARANGQPYAFYRDDLQSRMDGAIGPWWWHNNGEWVAWKTVCKFGTPTVLVPDPAADAPEMPHSHTDAGGDTLTFAPGSLNDRLLVHINDGGNDRVTLWRADAARMGRALLAWAGEQS